MGMEGKSSLPPYCGMKFSAQTCGDGLMEVLGAPLAEAKGGVNSSTVLI